MQGAEGDRQAAIAAKGNRVSDNDVPINQRFRSLDEYLAYLQQYEGPIDRAWYKEISPGVYELQTGNYRPLVGDDEQRVFTREELERKFGFRK
jgi:hypothetical protein